MYDLKKLVREHRTLSLHIRSHQSQALAGNRNVEITPAYARDRLRRHRLSTVLRNTGRKGLDQLLTEEDTLQWCITQEPGDDDNPRWRADRARVRREITQEIDPDVLSINQVTETSWRLSMALGEAYRGLPGLPLLRVVGSPYQQTVTWDQGPDGWPKTAAMRTVNGQFDGYWLRVHAGMSASDASNTMNLTGLELPSGVTVEPLSSVLLLKPEGIRS